MKRQNDKILSIERATDKKVYYVERPVCHEGVYIGDIVSIYKRFGWTRIITKKWDGDKHQNFYINYFD